MQDNNHNNLTIYATTILCVRKNGKVAIGGDGQVTFGNAVFKQTAKKIRRLYKDTILTGFAGSVGDAFTLFERLETKLEGYEGNLLRASIELAKDWRKEKYLRKLEAMMIVADKKETLIISGSGDVISPEHDIAAIGSGGNFALSAAKALIDIDGIEAIDIVKKGLKIAGETCIYTNTNIITDQIDSEN
jgi:ATP-dependent HslUV protease subunit HslV